MVKNTEINIFGLCVHEQFIFIIYWNWRFMCIAIEISCCRPVATENVFIDYEICNLMFFKNYQQLIEERANKLFVR